MAIIDGTSGDDTLNGGLGDDTFNGGAGSDIAVFGGNAADYRFEVVDGFFRVVDLNTADGNDGTDTLNSIETLRFADRDYAVNAPLAPLGEFRANTTTAGDQSSPAITALGDGGFVVSWISLDGSGYGIYAQRYDAAGAAVGSQFRANTTTLDYQFDPAITALGDGGFVVSWMSLSQDGSGYGIYAQRYDAAGAAVGGEFRANTTTLDSQGQPAITALGDGGFVVSWNSLNQDGSGYGIYAQRYDAAGAAVGGEFRANTTTLDSQDQPAITALGDGGFVVSWQSWSQDGSAYGIYAQRYDAAGAAVGSEFRANTTTANEQLYPTITALGDGGFVVGWMSYQDGSGYGIYAQRYDAAGAAVGGEFRANTTTVNDQASPAITALGDGGFVVSWMSANQDGSGGGIYAQRYDAAGNAVRLLEISGGINADVLNGGAGAQSLIGLGGNDTLDGGAGADSLAGGLGDDAYGVDDVGDVVSENPDEGSDTVTSTVDYTLAANVEYLTLSGSASSGTGNALDNALVGNGIANTLAGLGGNDTLDGGTGADSLTGGLGDDAYGVDDAGDVVSENPDEGSDTVTSTVDYTLGANVENLTLSGSASSGTGNALANALVGNGIANTLAGLAGNDTLDGGVGGGDALSGGTGDDTYISDGDVISENADEGTDTVLSSASVVLAVNVEHLTLTGTANLAGTGNSLDNAISGNSGANTLDGGAGADTLAGGAGNDSYYIDNANDVINESSTVPGEIDQVYSTLSWTLGANLENLSLTGSDAIDATGNSLNNMITGNIDENILDGGAGTDTVSYAIAGGAVNVSLALSDAQFTGATGWDTLLNFENLTGSNYNDTLSGNDAANTLNGGSGFDTLSGGAGNDIYIVGAGDVVVETSTLAGEIDLVKSTTSFRLGDYVENLQLTGTSNINGTGNALNNVLYASAGNNVLNGGTGTDTASYQFAGGAVTVSLAVATAQATGGSGSDTLTAIENLTGSAYNDTLTGNSGANVLSGGAGADTLSGGDSSDVYYVDNAGDIVTETNATTSTGGTETVNSYLAAYTLGTNVENGRILATGAADLTGNGLNNTLYAGTGNNALNGGTGTDTASYLYAGGAVSVSLAVAIAQATGGSGSDTLTAIENLTGSNHNDTLTGNAGANVLDGGAGADTLSGGDGADAYYVDNAGDIVTEAGTVGIDVVNSYLAAHTLGDNVENGRILATGTANLSGNSLNNVLYAGTGNNTLNGGAGADTVSYLYAGSAVSVSLALATAQATGGSGSDTLTAIESLYGSNYNDILTGNTAANALSGGAGNDTLSAGDGNDGLYGGLGNDTLTGGSGGDGFIFNTALNAATNMETITDFLSGTDKIKLDDAICTAIGALGNFVAGDARFYAAAGAVAGQDADDRVVYNTTTGALYYDADGSGATAAIQIALLGTSTHPGLAATDCVVI